MTHSLHRIGAINDLKGDYVVLACLAKGINRDSPEGRQGIIKIANIIKEHEPLNMIPEFTWKISPVVTAAFTDINEVMRVIQALKKEDLGISIVISGLISEIQAALKKVGLRMHTVHLSLGTFGKKEFLPNEEEILEITTMCGHHCISPQSVLHHLQQIKKGKITAEKAAEKLAKPCVCGIFNTERAASLLNKLSK